jgi:hypothetical protein
MPDDHSAARHSLAPTMPDLTGASYQTVLKWLHGMLTPRSYLEIGVQAGVTLALAKCSAIGIDPDFTFNDIDTVTRIVAKPSLMLFRMGSDRFFADHDPTALLGRPIDMAFLDGMHRCEFLLRDFINVERHCRPNSVIALHDCIPVEMPMAERLPGVPPIDPARIGMWTGDVWRTALLLRRVRPDLAMTVIDAAPTGLVLITNLNPASTVLQDGYNAHVRTMMGWSLTDLTLPGLYQELKLEPTANLHTDIDITARFWL